VSECPSRDRAYPFEKLEVWRLALELTGRAYAAARSLPKSEFYGLGDQLRRAAVSVGLNIAEGRAADSDAEFRRYLGIALKSLVEVIACLKTGAYLGMLNDDKVAEMGRSCDQLEAKLRSLRKTLVPK
jgi:four helix bundle protein